MRKRIRDIFDVPGKFLPGPRNSITDVPNVKVGQFTLREKDINTGITLIQSHENDAYLNPIPCAVYTGNGFGKLAGSLQVEELGVLESMIGLTNTLSVPMVMHGLIEFYLENNKEITSINVLVGETNDSGLNNIGALAIKSSHVKEAIENLSLDVEEGCVGAGTGTSCYGYKGGIGTSSRIVKDYVIGALVQSNYGGNLNIYGKPYPSGKPEAAGEGTSGGSLGSPDGAADGSCMIVLATNAPLDARQLKRIAKRGIAGMVQTGSYLAHGSGDFCIAFSNFPGNITERNNKELKTFTVLPEDQLNPLFEAACDAVREALYNSISMAEDMKTKDGKIVKAINLDEK
ncbi:MAG: P1 family peptidase [Treponema sp.]|nr:P1 family peptidase [Treponema sp.]